MNKPTSKPVPIIEVEDYEGQSVLVQIFNTLETTKSK